MKQKLKKHLNNLIDNWPAKILSFAFALILVQLYKSSLLEKRYFSVPLIIENSGELVPSSNIPRIIKVSIWGNAKDLAPIKDNDIVAYLDFSSIKNEGEYKLPIKTRIKGATGTNDSLEIEVHPNELKVNLAKILSKRVAVKLSLKGTPINNYEIYETQIDPSTIEISGPHTLISKIDESFTTSVSIDNRKTGFSGVAEIFNSNPLISVIGTSKISYSVKIREIVKMKTFKDVPLYFSNLKDELEIVSELPFGNVTVRGAKSVLENWELPSNVLQVLCENIEEPGIYSLPVKAIIPGKLEFIDGNPKNIQIEVKKRKIDKN